MQVRSLGLEDSPGIGNGSPLQYSCLENSMDRGAWQATVHGVLKSQSTRTHIWYPRESNRSPTEHGRSKIRIEKKPLGLDTMRSVIASASGSLGDMEKKDRLTGNMRHVSELTSRFFLQEVGQEREGER